MGTATILFEWKADYEVGHHQIDTQHKKLVEIMNRLYAAMLQGQGRNILGSTLEELIQYTKGHFSTEENLMKASGYAMLPAHKAKHDALTKQVVDFQKAFLAGRQANVPEIMQFLKAWLLHHIAESDKQLAKTLK